MKTLIFMVISPLLLQASTDDTQYWGSLSLSKSLNPEWTILYEGIQRYSVDLGENVLESNRTGVSYKFSDNLRLALIWAENTASTSSGYERRLIQQVNTTHEVEEWYLKTRWRLENRDFRGTDKILNRFRLTFRADSKIAWSQIVRPFAYTEGLWLLNSVQNRKAGTFEVRTQVGVMIEASKNWSVDVGYIDRRIWNTSNTMGEKNLTYKIPNLQVSGKF